jgi:hypothetical protein
MGKEAWWFAVATSAGMVFLLALAVVVDAISWNGPGLRTGVVAFVGVSNIALLAIAILRLRSLYREFRHPGADGGS